MKIEAKKTTNSSKSADNSSAEDEDSDSFSDDSSTYSKTSKNQKRKIPQFSVSQSDTVGLRMKISAIHRTDEKSQKRSSNNNNIRNIEKVKNMNSSRKQQRNKRKLSAISSSSCCSVCSRSESECSSTEIIKKEKPKKLKIKRKRVNSEVIHEVKCDGISTDSDCVTKRSNNKLKSIETKKNSIRSVQKGKKDTIHQADVHQTAMAAALIENTNVEEVIPGGSCISSSDTELPALVNAAIKCVESCSDSENPLSTEPKQYTSTLLRDFMVKTTQMLENSAEIESQQQRQLQESHQQQQNQQQSQSKKNQLTASNSNDVSGQPENAKSLAQWRKRRGRPKKSSQIDNIVNESADSGITSITQSLSPSPKNHHHYNNNISSGNNNNDHNSGNCSSQTSTNVNKLLIGNRSNLITTSAALVSESGKEQITIEQKRSATPCEQQHQQQKISIENLDKRMYAATERVLYPPRERKKPPPKQSTKNAKSSNKEDDLVDDNRSSNNIDPLWKKIDVNMKFRRPSLSGYKSDGGGSTICSKVLAARSGYVSDYGSVGTRNYSGYKSDVSAKSRSSMRSCVSRAKSCDYNRIRIKRLARRRRSSVSHAHHSVKSGNVNLEQDILQLAGLSLGQSSEESSRESTCKTSISKGHTKLYGEINRFITTGEYFGRGSSKNFSNFADLPLRKQQSMQDGNEYFGCGGIFGGSGSSVRANNSLPFSKEFDKFSKRIRSRRSSAVSRCSSFSTGSRHDNKKKRRRRMRYKLQSRNGFIDSKLNTEIEILINSFPNLCKIAVEKRINAGGKESREKSEKDKSSGFKTQSKRNQKKKKQNDAAEHHHYQHHTSTTNLKRRHKKNAHASPDDHKLPLKKRHYLLTPGEKSSEGKNAGVVDGKGKDKDGSFADTGGKSSGKSSNAGGSGKSSGGSKATVVTPKKRHLLETNNSRAEESSSTPRANQSATTISSNDNKSLTTKTNEVAGSDSSSVTQKSQNHHHTKGDTLTKKKNRLEGLLSKIQSANNVNSTTTSAKTTVSPVTTLSSSKSTTSESTTTTNQSSTGHPPPGVFEPTIELEIQIPLVKLTTDGIITKSEVESPIVSDLMDIDRLSGATEAAKSESGKGVVETLLNKTATVNLVLKRKRKKPINRTGFPSLKRKKRKVIDKITPTPIPATTAGSTENESINNQQKPSTPVVSNKYENPSEQEKLCDRVPHAGEASDTFLERNNKVPRLSVVSLERLQDPQKKRDATTPTNSTTDSTRKVPATSIEQNQNKAADKLLKNNLRVSPIHRGANKITTSSTNQKKVVEKKKQVEKVNKKIASKDKRSSSRSLKSTTVSTNNKDIEVPKASTINNNGKQAASAATIKLKVTNTENKVTTNSAVKNKSKRLTVNVADVKKDNKAKTEKKKKEKVSETTMVNTEVVEASEKVSKSNKKLKKETQQSTTVNNNKTESKSSTKTPTPEAANKKSNATKTELNESQKAASTADTISSYLPEELEQEPLPPLEVNEADSTDESDSTVKTKKTAKWRKSYLTAGLFSESYKSTRTKKGSGNGAKNEKDNNAVGSKEVKGENLKLIQAPQSLFPPPPYCEKFFRRTIQDFLLPYDVWWAYKNSKLPTKAMVPSWNYRKIRTNVYTDVRPNLVFDRQQCTCKPESGCGDDCLNRMVYAECSPANCPCDDKCTNQKIQKHEISPGTERFMTQNKGWGVRTSLSIKKGTYILEYVGEVVTEREFKERMATLYANDTHHYCLHLDGGLVIDGHRMGSDGRFVNHSCSPNCEMQKWSVNGLSRMALFALRDIEPGEELTYDYNFSLFNPSEGQQCRCETPQCRGVIGGKSQRVKPFEQKIMETTQASNAHSRSRKRQARKNSGRIQSKDFVATNLQQPSDREKKIIKGKNCFLIRNLEKVRRLKMKSSAKPSTTSGSSSRPSTPSSLAAQISALLRVPRNTMQTRVLTQAVTDPEVEKMAKLAAIFREICITLETVKDEEDKPLISKLAAASKKKQSSQDRTFTKLIDFPTVQANVEKGHYKTPEAFDEDVNSVFANAINYFEPGAEETLIVKRLSKEYTEKKKELYSKLVELIGEKSSKSFRITVGGKGTGVYNTHEDVIRCICGLFKDEGLMIQCSKCLVWQHTECTKANVNEENYLCERCEPRKVDLEIPLDEFTEENYRYYLSLLRGDLQIRQSDTVYVLRDIPIKDDDGNVLETKKHTYETIGKIDYSECDIFRVERLWKDNDGKRFIFGHHYLRPHETFHEPSRKFYENEVVRVPLYEVIPIELVIARCWVLDRKTFCLGRPVDCTSEEHVYICELRVNKTARLFAKNKQSYPICTKNYAFRRFKDKLHITRTYAPHDVDPSLLKIKKRKTNETPTISQQQQQQQQQQSQQQQQLQHQQNQQHQQKEKKTVGPVIQLMPPPPKTINEKRSRLENILKNLRLKQDVLPIASPPLDLSYLLTGRGARQRRANATIVPL